MENVSARMGWMEEQPNLLEIPERPPVEKEAGEPTEPVTPKLRTVDRAQMMMANIYVEELIPADHKARAIWELAGRLHLDGFAESLKTQAGGAGRPAWDPRLLVSVWVYAYSEGIGSAREIERLLEYEPGFQWLCGLCGINHHTLSDFRVKQKAALDELFAQMLALLEKEELLSLERVMHDGTKIRAQAGSDSFRRQKTVEEHLARARKVVEEMGDPREDRDRREAAKERAAREREERLRRVAEELEKIRATKEPAERAAARVSLTEPEARLMKHGDNAMAPSYNLQISTDAKQKAIVGIHLSQSSSDAQSLPAAVEEMEKNLGRKPEQMVVDGGFTNRGSMEAMAAKQIDLIGSMADPAERSAAAMKGLGIDPAFAPKFFIWDAATNTMRCPADRALAYKGQSRKNGNVYRQYQAQAAECAACPFRAKCCPKSSNGRIVSRLETENEAVAAMRHRMDTPAAKAIYRQRGEVAEFPNAWIKDKIGLRKFHVRGLAKAATEAVWACLTYNVQLWIRLVWRKPTPRAA
jgi:transposase